MSYHKLFAPWLVVCLLVGGYRAVPAQTTPPTQPPLLRQAQEGPVQPDQVAARKAAVQARLEALGEPDPQKKDQEEARAILEQILKTLTAIEKTLQNYTTFTTQMAELPQHLRELEAQAAELEVRPPGNFPAVTDQLRDQYQSQLQTTQAEIQELIKQTRSRRSAYC